MKGIKTTLTFLLGAITASLWWASFTLNLQEFIKELLFPITSCISILLILGVIFWLADHWNDK